MNVWSVNSIAVMSLMTTSGRDSSRHRGKGERGGQRRLRLLLQATYIPEIHPKTVWAKLESLAEGARRATERLW